MCPTDTAGAYKYDLDKSLIPAVSCFTKFTYPKSVSTIKKDKKLLQKLQNNIEMPFFSVFSCHTQSSTYLGLCLSFSSPFPFFGLPLFSFFCCLLQIQILQIPTVVF